MLKVKYGTENAMNYLITLSFHCEAVVTFEYFW